MNRSTRRASLAAALALALGACVPSLSPLYTEKDLVVDPKLVGTWTDPEESSASWTFEAGEGKSYRLIVRDTEGGRKKEGVFLAHLVALRGHRFLDLLPDPASLQATELGVIYKMTLVPAHLILRVDEIGDHLQIAMLDPQWLGKLLKRRPRAIDHRTIGDDGIVLTASTRELQRFVLEHVESEEAFDSPSRLERQAGAR